MPNSIIDTFPANPEVPKSDKNEIVDGFDIASRLSQSTLNQITEFHAESVEYEKFFLSLEIFNSIQKDLKDCLEETLEELEAPTLLEAVRKIIHLLAPNKMPNPRQDFDSQASDLGSTALQSDISEA